MDLKEFKSGAFRQQYQYRSFTPSQVSAADVGKILKVTPKTANEMIQDLVHLKVLVEVTGGRRNRVFSFQEYVDLFSG